MNSNEYFQPVGADTSAAAANYPDLIDLSFHQQVNLYLYDLQNEAREHGFKNDDCWKIIMVTDTERIQIQRNYFPVVSQCLNPDVMWLFFHHVKTKLTQPLSKDEENVDVLTIIRDELKYIIAYNPKRERN